MSERWWRMEGGGYTEWTDNEDKAAAADEDGCDVTGPFVPEPDTFADLLAVARRIVDEHYPADVFPSPHFDTRDPGVQLVTALRACDRAVHEATPGDDATTKEGR